MSESIQINNAVSKKTKVGETIDNGRDIISTLPESITTQILSLLPTKDAVRTCVLSKNWEYNWTKIENLEIDDSDLFSHPRTKKKSFVNFVDRILLFCDVKRFRLRCYQNYDKGRMVTWISSLLVKNIPSIDITYTRCDIVIPRCLFYCTSLTRLKLGMPCTLRVPVRNWFSRLKNLYFSRVKIVNELFPNDRRLVFTFPVLETCELEFCTWLNVELVEINAPALRRFKACSKLSQAGSYQIKISGARVATFEIRGDFLENFDLSESSVNYAAIGDANLLYGYIVHRHNGLQARTLLKGFSDLKHLKLSAGIFSALSHTKGELPFPRFVELKQLEIYIVHDDEEFLELLHAAPSLETLILHVGGRNHREVELESVPPCVVSHLKEVRSYDFSGLKHQVQMAEYILNNALKLEKMLGLARVKRAENPVGKRFWKILKGAFENGDLELGCDIKSMTDFEEAFGGAKL